MDPHLSTLYAFEEGRSFASVLGAPPRRSPPHTSTTSSISGNLHSPPKSALLHPDTTTIHSQNRLSPLSIPLASSPSGSPPAATNNSPQIPPAPQHNTIPLPHDTSEGPQYQFQQFQQQQSRSGLGTPSSNPALSREATTIDLTKLAGPALPKTTISPPTIDISNPASIQVLTKGQRNSSSDHSQMADYDLGEAPDVPMQGQKTPNVYINGLPPHFPEDQLFALAAPFGEIRSVRTFTRHVRDSESGYGFVLFETIDAAERCINSLRRYRNLHPTFSKQIHKIPGTQYASIPSSNSAWSGHSSDSSPATPLDGNASFKVKMESLHDPTSTNLYMEGLPLSIDDNALAKLVAPHRIISSRFFQTRLSNPPRIIAFVRLDTRRGAEEVIENLHGQMVRGANDPGCRISVRFADTSEQRELRRQERAAQEGDSSPTRLTMAQASLLNLHGPGIGVKSRMDTKPSPSASIPASASDFAANIAHNLTNVPVIGTQRSANTLNVDYSLAPPRSSFSGHSSRERSPVGLPHYPLPVNDLYGLGHSPSPMDPAMLALLGSLNANTDESAYALDYTAGAFGHVNPALSMGVNGMLPVQNPLVGGYVRTPPVSTRTGYTPAEEYIMRAHAESAALAQAQIQAQALQQQQQQERRRPAPLDLRRGRMGDDALYGGDDANVGAGMRGYRSQASLGRVGQQQGVISPPGSATGMAMGVDEGLRSQFMAMGLDSDGDAAGRGLNASRHAPQQQQQQSQTRSTPGAASAFAISPRLGLGQNQQQSQGDGVDGELHQHHQQQSAHGAHMRSTTLPPRSAPSTRYAHQTPAGSSSASTQPHKGHYTHSSMSIPAPSMRTPQHASVGAMSGPTVDQQQQQGVIYEGEQLEMDYPKTAALVMGQVGVAGRGQQQVPASAPAGKSTYSVGLFGEIGQGSAGGGSSASSGGGNGNGNGNGLGVAHTNANGSTGTPTSNSNANSSPTAATISSNGASNMHSSSSSSSLAAPTSGTSTNASPTMISPTLTYSSQTPSTLSPATPFFGSFNGAAGDHGFQGPQGVSNEGKGMQMGQGTGTGAHGHGQ